MSRPSGTAMVSRGVLTLAAVLWFWSGSTVPCRGQVDPMPQGNPQSGMPARPMPTTPGPAVIDTALAVFEFSPDSPVPVTGHTLQDTVMFGDVIHLVLDYSPAVDGLPALEPAPGAQWLSPVARGKPGLISRILGKNGGPDPDTSSLADPGDMVRVVHSFRVYRTNPFRLQAGSFLSPVIQVRGRVEASGETAAIRGPRPGGWSPLVVLGLLVLFFLVLLIARWLWNRGTGREEYADRELPAPAWLAAAIELRDLMQAGFLQRGENRGFLDGLAGIARRFVAGRYRIAAQDMTGREIIAACSDLGHRSSHPGSFARLIDAVDCSRYDPEASGVPWCREQAVRFFDQVAETRIMPRYTEVPEELRRRGDSAWTGLERELSAGSRRSPQAPDTVGEGEV